MFMGLHLLALNNISCVLSVFKVLQVFLEEVTVCSRAICWHSTWSSAHRQTLVTCCLREIIDKGQKQKWSSTLPPNTKINVMVFKKVVVRHTPTIYDTLHCCSNITDDETSCYQEVHLNTMIQCIVVQVLHLMVK